MMSTSRFTERELDRIIEMAWEDRTPFEALLFQFGLPEKEVIKVMRASLKESSFKRWRELYRNANRLIDRARSLMDDPTIKTGAQEKKNANRDHFLAQRQRELLLNDSLKGTSQSEFYIFRYLHTSYCHSI